MFKSKLSVVLGLTFMFFNPSVLFATTSEPQQAEKTQGPHPKLLESFMSKQVGAGAQHEQLMRLNALIQSQIETSKLRSELAKVQGGASSDPPSIVAISVFNGLPKALLKKSDGSYISVEQGDKIEGVGRVSSITKDGVMLERIFGKKTDQIKLTTAKVADDKSSPAGAPVTPMLRTQ